jgi:hypothetical protein
MIIDRILQFSDDQAVTSSAASTDYQDLGAANLDLPQGTPLWLWIILTAAFDTSANTLTIDLRNDGNTPPTTKVKEVLPATATSALLTPAILVRESLPILNGRYVNLYYTCSAGLTSGTLTAFVTVH